MEEIITKDNLDTYTQGLKGVLSSMGEAINNSSLESKVDNIQTDVTDIKTAVTTPQISGCTVTVTAVGYGNEFDPHFTVTSGTATIGTYEGTGTFTIPIGAEYDIVNYYKNTNYIAGQTHRTATTLAESITLPCGFVDLGTSDNKLWSLHNLGTYSPAENGLYYSWGNTTGYYTAGSYFTEEYYATTPGHNVSYNYSSVGDPAKTVLGGNWYTPSTTEWSKLFLACNVSYDSSVGGIAFTSKSNGNKLIIPDSGGFMSSTGNTNGYARYWTPLYQNSTSALYCTVTVSNSAFSLSSNYNSKYYGANIRAVMNKPS